MFSQALRRPVLSIVISILIVFVGLLALRNLPVSQFPQVAPTTVNIFIAYPGASADVLTKSTIIPLEQAINGVPGMRYIISDATSAGEGTIQVVFDPGISPDEPVVRVKIRVDQVMPLLPPLVQREGVIITPIDPSMLMYINLYATDSTMDEKFLYNYAFTKMIPEQQRIKGGGTGADSGESDLCDAGMAQSRPHARLQRLRRRSHGSHAPAEPAGASRTARTELR